MLRLPRADATGLRTFAFRHNNFCCGKLMILADSMQAKISVNSDSFLKWKLSTLSSRCRPSVGAFQSYQASLEAQRGLTYHQLLCGGEQPRCHRVEKTCANRKVVIRVETWRSVCTCCAKDSSSGICSRVLFLGWPRACRKATNVRMFAVWACEI